MSTQILQQLCQKIGNALKCKHCKSECCYDLLDIEIDNTEEPNAYDQRGKCTYTCCSLTDEQETRSCCEINVEEEVRENMDKHNQ